MSEEGATAVVHPLQSAWTLTAQGLDGKSDKASNWDKNRKFITTFDTLEDFWRLFNNTSKPSALPMGCDVHLFKKGIVPDWDDEINAPGGRWIANLAKSGPAVDDFWMNAIMAAVGEMLDDDEAVTGVVLSLRAKGPRLALWIRESKNVELVRRIGLRFKTLLGIPEKIDFNSHAEEKNKDKMPTMSV